MTHMRVGSIELASELSYLNPSSEWPHALEVRLETVRVQNERALLPFPSFIRARSPISLSFPLCWVESVETALEMASLIRLLPSFPASLPLFGTRQIAWCLAHTAHTTLQHTSLPLSSFSRVRERAQLRLRGGKQEIRPLRNYGRKEARRVSGRTSDETGPSLSPFRTSF